MIYRLLVIPLFLSNSLWCQDAWIQVDSLNGPPRANATTFTIENDGYVLTGYDGTSKKRSMVSYDPVQDDWDNELSLGGLTGDGLNRSSAVSFSVWGYGFIVTGEGTGFMFSDLWMYDPYNQSWTQMANFPGGARAQAISFCINNIGYVGLGKLSDLSTFMNDFWAYDFLQNSWTQKADFPGTARMDAVAVNMGNQGYAGLGYDGNNYPNDFYCYDPELDDWTQKASFPGQPRSNATAFSKFPQLLIFTGDNGFTYFNDTWEYNYFGDTWTQRSDFPGGSRTGACAFEINGRLFAGTGYANGQYYDDWYEYGFLLAQENEIFLDLSIFPNPTSQIATIQLSGTSLDMDISIYNEQGQDISSQIAVSVISDQEIKVNFNSLSDGKYYVIVSNDQQALKSVPIVLLR